jgi:hypothetical protein
MSIPIPCQNQECLNRQFYGISFLTGGVFRPFIDFITEEIECRNSPCPGRFSSFRGSVRLFWFAYGLAWTGDLFFEGLLASR